VTYVAPSEATAAEKVALAARKTLEIVSVAAGKAAKARSIRNATSAAAAAAFAIDNRTFDHVFIPPLERLFDTFPSPTQAELDDGHLILAAAQYIKQCEASGGILTSFAMRKAHSLVAADKKAAVEKSALFLKKKVKIGDNNLRDSTRKHAVSLFAAAGLPEPTAQYLAVMEALIAQTTPDVIDANQRKSKAQAKGIALN
jgi:hypothetical protein